MKSKVLLGLLLSFIALTMAACGGDSNNNSFIFGSSGTTVSGTVAKGLVSGATVKVFEIISSHSPARARIAATALNQGTTLADGSFAINIGSVVRKGGLLIQATGGTYTDEATGTANTNLSSPLNAAFGNISGMIRRGDSIAVSVTPFTELGFQALDVVNNRPTDANIAAANGKVVSTLGLTGVNILTTKPFAVGATPPVGATPAQITYTQALATVSQMMAGGKTLAQVGAQFLPDIQAGALTQANKNEADVARLNFLNSTFNKSGAAPAVTVTVTSSKAVVSNDNVDSSVITATVTLDGVAAPDGTQVKFAIKSGAGANLSAATATTAAGVASVNLKGTIDGAAVVVTASAGGVAADAPTVTFLDPNKPGAVALTANPTTGVTTAVSPIPVTLTATVSPVSPQGVIANGTTVTFTITSGSGATLSAATATTTGGVASVTLSSALANTISVTARAGIITSAPVAVPFVDQPTQAVVTVSLVGTLPAGTLIGGTNALIGFNTTRGLGTPVSAKVGIGNTADAFITNAGLNPTITPAAWQTGTQPGALMTLTFPITAGILPFPTAADFTVDPASVVIDLNQASLAGVISVTITNVQLQ